MKLFAQFEKEISVLALAWILFLIYLLFNYLVYNKQVLGSSAVVRLLEIIGYRWAFGVVVGTTVILAAAIAYLILEVVSNGGIPITSGLIIGVILSYLLAIIGLNLWAKRFQRQRGIKLDPNVGWKWFVNDWRKYFEESKRRRKRKGNS